METYSEMINAQIDARRIELIIRVKQGMAEITCKTEEEERKQNIRIHEIRFSDNRKQQENEEIQSGHQGNAEV